MPRSGRGKDSELHLHSLWFLGFLKRTILLEKVSLLDPSRKRTCIGLNGGPTMIWVLS